MRSSSDLTEWFVCSCLLRLFLCPCRWCDADTLVYHAGAVAFVHNVARNRQQHYTAHNDDITSLAVCLKPRMVATGQCGKVARIQVWGIDSCTTASSITNPAIQRRVTALSWSRTGSHLVAVGGDDNRTAFIFSFLRRGSAAQAYKENLLGAASASKESTDDQSRQQTPSFFPPTLLFSVAMQVHRIALFCFADCHPMTAASGRVRRAIQLLQWKRRRGRILGCG